MERKPEGFQAMHSTITKPTLGLACSDCAVVGCGWVLLLLPCSSCAAAMGTLRERGAMVNYAKTASFGVFQYALKRANCLNSWRFDYLTVLYVFP